MCGRFTIAKPERVTVDLSPDEILSDLNAPRYNIAPMQQIPALLQRKSGNKVLADIRWGFLPPWAGDPQTGSRIINARSETAATKATFRAAFRGTRCLIPADGFYEWQVTPEGKQPVYMQIDGGELFVLAGLYTVKKGEGSDPLVTGTILTTTPNEVVAPIHKRMPVILPAEHWNAWLDRNNANVSELEEMLQPFPADRMTAHKVSRLVNSPSNDDARCIEPVE